jgi:hypothetical protein
MPFQKLSVKTHEDFLPTFLLWAACLPKYTPHMSAGAANASTFDAKISTKFNIEGTWQS